MGEHLGCLSPMLSESEGGSKVRWKCSQSVSLIISSVLEASRVHSLWRSLKGKKTAPTPLFGLWTLGLCNDFIWFCFIVFKLTTLTSCRKIEQHTTPTVQLFKWLCTKTVLSFQRSLIPPFSWWLKWLTGRALEEAVNLNKNTFKAHLNQSHTTDRWSPALLFGPPTVPLASV